MKLNPQVIEKDGQQMFVVLPFDEFQRLEEIMHDFEDLQALRLAKAASLGQNGIALDDVISELGLKDKN